MDSVLSKQKADSLADIAEDIIRDGVCAELAAGATQLVAGDGDPDAELVFVGEAPGRQEDEQGKPFVGASGQFLDEMLQTITLKRQDVYITNIVKYRPPNNRDPLPHEKAAFAPYLALQLTTIEPKLVVSLGKHAGEFFLPELKVSRDHGQLQWSDQLGGSADSKLAVLPLYHPAAALYNGNMKEVLIADFKRIPEIIKKL